jgi:uncharacterized membrane protein YfcA
LIVAGFMVGIDEAVVGVGVGVGVVPLAATEEKDAESVATAGGV